MNPATRRRVENGAATGLVLVAVGLRVGLWAADHAAFFLPKVTPRRLLELERQAKRAARREQAVPALRSPMARGSWLKPGHSARSNRAGGTS